MHNHTPSSFHFTPREKQITALLILGNKHYQISQFLGNSQHTVDKQIATLRYKLGVFNSAALVGIALTLGFTVDYKNRDVFYNDKPIVLGDKLCEEKKETD